MKTTETVISETRSNVTAGYGFASLPGRYQNQNGNITEFNGNLNNNIVRTATLPSTRHG